MSVFISSTSNSKVKDIVQLLTKSRARKNSGLCVVEGEREITRALEAGWQGEELWLLENADSQIDVSSFPKLYIASSKVFDKIAYRSATQHAVAVFHTPQTGFDQADALLQSSGAVLIMEGVEKPGNLGAVLRTAVAAGVKAVFLADAAVDPYNPNVVRNAAGALFEIPLFAGSSADLLAVLRENDFTIFCTHMHEEALHLFEFQWPAKSAIVLGEEANGLTDKWVGFSDENIIIPMEGSTVDSLNVSVAAAVLMYHWKGQQFE